MSSASQSKRYPVLPRVSSAANFSYQIPVLTDTTDFSSYGDEGLKRQSSEHQEKCIDIFFPTYSVLDKNNESLSVYERVNRSSLRAQLGLDSITVSTPAARSNFGEDQDGVKSLSNENNGIHQPSSGSRPASLRMNSITNSSSPVSIIPASLADLLNLEPPKPTKVKDTLDIPAHNSKPLRKIKLQLKENLTCIEKSGAIVKYDILGDIQALNSRIIEEAPKISIKINDTSSVVDKIQSEIESPKDLIIFQQPEQSHVPTELKFSLDASISSATSIPTPICKYTLSSKHRVLPLKAKSKLSLVTEPVLLRLIIQIAFNSQFTCPLQQCKVQVSLAPVSAKINIASVSCDPSIGQYDLTKKIVSWTFSEPISSSITPRLTLTADISFDGDAPNSSILSELVSSSSNLPMIVKGQYVSWLISGLQDIVATLENDIDNVALIIDKISPVEFKYM